MKCCRCRLSLIAAFSFIGLFFIAGLVLAGIGGANLQDGCVAHNCTYVDDIGMGMHGCVKSVPGTVWSCENLFVPCPTDTNICYGEVGWDPNVWHCPGMGCQSQGYTLMTISGGVVAGFSVIAGIVLAFWIPCLEDPELKPLLKP